MLYKVTIIFYITIKEINITQIKITFENLNHYLVGHMNLDILSQLRFIKKGDQQESETIIKFN